LVFGSGSDGNTIAGNKIGTDATGTASLPNQSGGIVIAPGTSNDTIGGTTAGAGNLIAYNGGSGVVVFDFSDAMSVGDQITGNRIFANSGQAIDLGGDGVTYNASSPRQGANNLQNFPIIVTTANGQLEGRLWGSLPDTTFRVDIFASAAYNADESGEAEDYLGSMEVTTDASGQLVFAVPFTAPAGLPFITATATDPQGNTSEVSALRRAALRLPSGSIRVVPDQGLNFATASGDRIAIQDPDAGPLDPAWDLTLSVGAGTLTLPSTAGLTGSGNGTGSLSYRGPLSAIDAALEGMIFNPPAGPHVLTTLTLGAQSVGAPPLQTQFVISDGVFVVDTTADSGPGSLRQAILDANSVTGLTVTIDFAIPGASVQTIEPITPLPPITASLLVDGTTQPGFAGTPLIALGGQSPGSSGQLVISGGNVTIRGLALDGVTIDATADERLIAVVATQGATSQLSLLDAQGHVLVQNDGASSDNPADVIDEHLAAGDYSLALDSNGGPGASTWTTMLMPSAAPFQPIPVGSTATAIVAGDFNGDRHLDLAVADSGSNEVSILLGNGDGTLQPAVTYTVGFFPNAIVAGDFTGDGRLDLAVANGDDTVSVLLGNGDGTFRPQVTYAVLTSPDALVAGDFTGGGQLDLAVAGSDGIEMLLGHGDGTFEPLSGQNNVVGSGPDAIAAGDFNGDGHLDLAVADQYSNEVSILLGNGDGTFQSQVTYAVGVDPDALVAGDFNGDGHLDLAVASANYNPVTGTFVGEVSVLLGNGDGTFQPQVTYAVGSAPDAIVAGDFTGDGHLDLAVTNGNDNTVSLLLGNGDGTFQPQVTYAVGSSPGAIVAGDFTGNGHLDLAVADFLYSQVSILLGNGDGTFQPAVTYAVGVTSLTTGAIVAGDFTGDGHLDLALVGVNYNFVTHEAVGIVSVLLGNGDGTFQPQVTYAVGSDLGGIVAGDFTGDGHLDLAVPSGNYNSVTGTFMGEVSLLLGNGDGTFQTAVDYAVGNFPHPIVAGDFNGDGRLDLAVADSIANSVSVLLGNGDGTFTDSGQWATTPHAMPLVADVNGDGADDVLVVDGHGHILYRQGIPGQPGSFEPPVTVNPNNLSRDIAWLPNTDQGPVLASVDAQDDRISFYGYRDGQFVLIGSLDTGRLPAQILAANLRGDGFTDLVVRNAGDGSLSVYFGAPVSDSRIVGPMGSLEPPTFLPAVTLPVGLGVSDVQAVDTTGSGTLDLVVTNKLTSQVSVLSNDGNGLFAAAVPYRAGTGLSAIDPSSTPEVTSLEATAGVAAGPLTPGGPSSLATINPGSNTLDILANLGGGRFANPVTIETQGAAEVVRMADFTGNGIADLAVLTAQGVSIYLGDGRGGFSSPVTYDAGVGPTGLTVADVLGNGKLDLLVGNAYGDVLILVGNGDGTFRPFEPVKADIALAVADLTGNGALDFVFADQSLNRVTVVYGSTSQSATSPQVIGNQATGVLAPGAVKLADLTGDGIPDLIVANSGGNNVLVYPGLGNGQFGPPVNGTKGFPVGTDPTGLAVADLNGQPDLLVADSGSNDVSVLLGQGTGSSWTMTSGPRIQTDAGPVALAVGHLLGPTQTDLAVANSGADNVQIFPGVGGGFFNDQPKAVKTVPVGQAPSSLFLGDFNGLGQGLATLNAASNDGTLISGLNSTSPTTQTFPTGGNSPTSGFAGDFTGDGFSDLVVGNNGDGHLALLLGGAGGLSLSQTLVSAEAPNPTSLSFAGVSDGQLSFYVSTAGREAAMNLAFNLEGGAGSELGSSPLAPTSTGESSPSAVLSQATSGSVQQVSQLLSLTGTTLDLAATLLTVSVVSIESESGASGGLASVGTTGLGQPVIQAKGNGGSGGSAEEPGTEDAESGAAGTPATIESLPAWERLSIGLGRAWEKARAAILRLEGQEPAAGDSQSSARPAILPPAGGTVPAPVLPRPRSDAATSGRALQRTPADVQADLRGVVDAALEGLDADRPGERPAAKRAGESHDDPAQAEHPDLARVLVVLAASAAAAGSAWGLSSIRIRQRSAKPARPRNPKTSLKSAVDAPKASRFPSRNQGLESSRRRRVSRRGSISLEVAEAPRIR
jgi:hypothetical protein